MRFVIADLETTGVEPTDRVVEIALVEMIGEEILRPHGYLINPRIPIPPTLSAIHHIIDEDVIDKADWETSAPILFREREKLSSDSAFGRIAAYVAHNAKFERQWITDDLTGGKPWICTYRCAMRIWPDAPSHSNQALRYWLAPPGLDRSIAREAHRAGPDAYVTAFTLRELLKQATFDELVTWSSQPALLPRVPFGKHKGAKWADIPPDYLAWMLRQADMSEDVRFTANYHFKGGYS